MIAKPIEVVPWTDTRGSINPVRFKATKEGGTNSVVKIDKVICADKDKLAGNNMLVYGQIKSIFIIKKEIFTNCNSNVF